MSLAIPSFPRFVLKAIVCLTIKRYSCTFEMEKIKSQLAGGAHQGWVQVTLEVLELLIPCGLDGSRRWGVRAGAGC